MDASTVIHFDGRCLQDPGYRSSGIGTYARWLLTRLAGSRRVVVKLVVSGGDEPAPMLPDGIDIETIPFDAMRSGIYFNPSLMTHGAEPLDLANARGLTSVGVLHDLIPLRRPTESSDYDRRLFARMLDKSRELDAVVVNSFGTMADYRDWRGAESPIFTFHPESRFTAGGVDRPMARASSQALLGIAEPYAFFAVADHPRKNIELALLAAPALHQRGYATVIGGGISDATVARLGNEYDVATVRFTPRLSDRDLAAMYVGAEVVVVPSFDEGFSLPVLEALELGCRVLVSDIPVHREQVRSPSHAFAPDDVDDFLRAWDVTASTKGTDGVSFDRAEELTKFLGWLENRAIEEVRSSR